MLPFECGICRYSGYASEIRISGTRYICIDVLACDERRHILYKTKENSNMTFNNKTHQTFADFNDYQMAATRFARYPDMGNNFTYPMLGLCGEVGEVSEKIKKIIRDENGIITNTRREEIMKELGDVLWYVSQLAVELNLQLADIAEGNLEKLSSRADRNKLHGSGDNR